MFEKTIVNAPAKENFSQLCKVAKAFPSITEGIDFQALKVNLKIPEGATPEEIRKITAKSGVTGIINIFETILEKKTDELFEFLSLCFYSTKEEVENANLMDLVIPILELIKSKEVVSFFTSFTESEKMNSAE